MCGIKCKHWQIFMYKYVYDVALYSLKNAWFFRAILARLLYVRTVYFSLFPYKFMHVYRYYVYLSQIECEWKTMQMIFPCTGSLRFNIHTHTPRIRLDCNCDHAISNLSQCKHWTSKKRHHSVRDILFSATMANTHTQTVHPANQICIKNSFKQ